MRRALQRKEITQLLAHGAVDLDIDFGDQKMVLADNIRGPAE